MPPLGPDKVAKGASIYARECARCHSLPGGERPSWTHGMRPEPPHLAEEGTHFDLAGIYWLVENGARMTGMPSWSHLLSEDEIWAVAAFVDSMPGLTPDEYQKLLVEPGNGQTANEQANASGGAAGEGSAETATAEPQAPAGEPQSERAPAQQATSSDPGKARQEAQSAKQTTGEAKPGEQETSAADGEGQGRAGESQQFEGAPAQQTTSSHPGKVGQEALIADNTGEGGSGEQKDSGAGGDGQPAQEPGAADAGASGPAVTVGMTNSLKFTPPKVTISAGDTVLWRNSSDVQHTVTADRDKVSNPENMHLPEGAEPFDSGTLQPGAEWSYTFDVAGRYQYVCLPHEAAGMIGEVKRNNRFRTRYLRNHKGGLS